MSDLCVARVLSSLELCERQLGDLERSVRAELAELQVPFGPSASLTWHAFRQREQFQLGQIEGLIRAQLALQARRVAYAQTHRNIHQLAALPASVPAGDAGL